MWKPFGFASATYSQGTGSFQVNKTPLTTDFINWRLPTNIPIIRGTLVLIVNGLHEENGVSFVETEDGLGFIWTSPNPLTSDDSIKSMYAV